MCHVKMMDGGETRTTTTATTATTAATTRGGGGRGGGGMKRNINNVVTSVQVARYVFSSNNGKNKNGVQLSLHYCHACIFLLFQGKLNFTSSSSPSSGCNKAPFGIFSGFFRDFFGIFSGFFRDFIGILRIFRVVEDVSVT